MTIAPVYGLPGVRSVKTATHRIAFLQAWLDYLAQGRVIDGSKSRDPGNTGDEAVLRAGLLMGRITTGGKYAPSILGVTQSVGGAGATSITVTSAQAAEIVRRVGATGNLKYIGPPSANGTVAVQGPFAYSAINTGTGAITTAAVTAATVAGTFVTPADGSELPVTLIPDGYGFKVTDYDGTNLDVPFSPLPIAGVLDSSQILPAWPTDTSLQQWIFDSLSKTSAGKFIGDHSY